MFKTVRLIIFTIICLQLQSYAVVKQKAVSNDVGGSTPKRMRVLEIAPDHLLLQFDFDSLTWTGGEDSIPRLKGMLYPSESGKPCLPASVHIFQAPPGKASVRILSDEKVRHRTGHIPPSFTDDLKGGIREVIDRELYRRDAFYPFKPVDVSPIGSFRGRKLMRIMVYPLQYNPVREEVVFHRRMKIRVDFSGGEGVPPQRLHGSAERTLNNLLWELPETSGYLSPPPSYPQTSSIGFNPIGIKIAISDEGLHRLTYEALADSGINMAMLGDPRNFRLSSRGTDAPIYVSGETDGSFDPGDYIDFWGVPNRQTYQSEHPDMYTDPWSDRNIYWFTWGGAPSPHMIEETVEIIALIDTLFYHPYSYTYTVHEEVDNNYNRLTQVPRDEVVDHWFYDSGIDGFESKSYTVHLPHPQSTSVEYAQLKAMLMGLTYPAKIDPENTTGRHHAWMTFNGYTTPSMQAGAVVNGVWPWVGQTIWAVETTGTQGIPNNILHHGENILTVLVPGDTPSGSTDIIMFNWFELTYLREYKADNGWIKFTRPEQGPTDRLYDFEIRNFPSSDILLYKIGSSRLIEYQMNYDNQSDTYTLHFQDMIYGDEEYIALTPENIKTPDYILIDTPSELTNPANQSEFIIITFSDFVDNPAVLELRDRRAENGAIIIDVEDIYDEFNYGIQNPEAIKTFLTFAYYNWFEHAPFSVLLIGDGSWDQKDRFGGGGNLVPSYYMQTSGYGAAAADVWFTLIDGDDFIPDMTIGRIPARTNVELEDYLSKIAQYELQPVSGEWHNRYLFISGNSQGQTSSFTVHSEECIELLPTGYYPERVESVENVASPYNGSTPELQEFFRSGVSIVNYNGHGAGQIWSDNSMFTLADVANMNNPGLYPFVANFTCYICSYDDPNPRTTLGEEFIFIEGEGAIGVYGSTGTGWFLEGNYLQKAMINALQPGERMTQGELVLLSKILYIGSRPEINPYSLTDKAHATIHTMALLGDPGVIIRTPQHSSDIDMDPIISRGDTVQIQTEVPIASGSAVLRIFDKDRFPIFRENFVWQSDPVQFSDSEVTIEVDTNQVNFPHRGTFRISYWDPVGNEDGSAFADFYTIEYFDSTLFDSLRIIPTNVLDTDPIYFYCRLIDSSNINWAAAVYYIENPDLQIVQPNDTLDLYQPDPEDIVWRSVILPPFYGMINYRIKYYFIAENGQGIMSNSIATTNAVLTEVITDHRPDLETYPQVVELGGQRLMELSARVEAKNTNDVDSVEVEFWAGKEKPGGGSSKLDFLGSTWVHQVSIDSLPRYATINPSFEDGLYHVHVFIIPDSIEDKDPSNNSADLNITIDRAYVSPDSGTNNSGASFDFHFNDYTLSITPNAVDDSTLLVAAIDSGVVIVNQPSLTFFGDTLGLKLDFTTHSDTLLLLDGLMVMWKVEAGAPDTLQGITAIHRWHPVDSVWEKLPTELSVIEGDSGFIASASSSLLGIFTLLINGDSEGPQAEVSIDGQLYTSGGYVPSQPRISVLFQDVGGVNASSIWAAIDGDTLESEALSLPVICDNARSVSTSIHEILSPGEHTVTFGVEDLSGNSSFIPIIVEVADGFDFEYVGNYPNPFKNKTYIACSITDQPIGDLIVKIYTVAGRLVRTLRKPAKVNYNEIKWDGKDEERKILANGVYFCRITAEKSDKKIERMMKMAKVR